MKDKSNLDIPLFLRQWIIMGIVELEEMPERIRSIGYRQGRRLDFTEREVFERRPQRSRQFAEAYVFECCCPRSLHDRKAPPWIVLGAVARMVCDWWISQWTDDKFQRTDLFYALGYLGRAFLVALGVVVAGFTYSRASLPVACGVSVDPKALIPCTEDGFWAVRVVRRDGRDTRPVPVRAKLIHSRNPLPHLLHEIS